MALTWADKRGLKRHADHLLAMHAGEDGITILKAGASVESRRGRIVEVYRKASLPREDAMPKPARVPDLAMTDCAGHRGVSDEGFEVMRQSWAESVKYLRHTEAKGLDTEE